MARAVRVVAFLLLCAVGALAGALLAGRTGAEVGAFRATVSLRPSLTGDTVVKLAPLGTLTLDTHDGPLGLMVSADEFDLEAARRAGAGAAAALRRPSRRAVTVGAVTALVATGSMALVVRTSWNPNAIGEPRYTGLLTAAPQAIGAVEQVQKRYAEYRLQVAALVRNIAQL